jgi:hypothetical protein
MTAAETTTPAAGRGRAAGRFAFTLLIFALVGPIVGGLVTIAGLTLFGMNIWEPGDAMMVIGVMIIYGLWIAYPLGIVPAVIVGVLIGIKDIYGGTRFWQAIILGVVAGLVWSRYAGSSAEWGKTFVTPVLVAAALIATIVCWRLTRRRIRSGAPA